MKIDYCDRCGQVVYFENTTCLACDSQLAFFPDTRSVVALEKLDGDLWRCATAPEGRRYRKCENFRVHNACNWVVDAADANPYCLSCRLTRVVPDLDKPNERYAWLKLETAKRRFVYGALALKLPTQSKHEDPEHGLAFEFPPDPDPADKNARPVLTGHANGVIVVNIAEADDVERLRRKKALHEPYRTLLGHFRHESGHYYWDRLIAHTKWLEPFRALFGDETADYGESLQRHYKNGPPEDWNLRFISAYATCHPWEDWAESWAHYMHMIDSVETARSLGIHIRPPHRDVTKAADPDALDAILCDWFALTCALNNLNRGLGQPDAYPFVMTEPVIAKIRFIHGLLGKQ